ncbi:hypothetical protein OBBRIDRAFT_798116 [Obba rivulosa]|uniref:Uncharacterized protein n=1 Tax=Obba rivulosa TaxID=1052685 RepID=A0A8E2AJ64_9APHY|nr:hypothetical protein OBBRIDRAFT_798116 [Obba rivulosa]
MALSFTKARILALFFTDIAAGIHFITFSDSLWTQLVRRPQRGRNTNWVLVAVTLCMGIIGSIHAALDVALNIQVWSTGISLSTDLPQWENITAVSRP